MKQQHTPGPWIFNGGEVVDSHDNTIALVNAMNQWDTTEGIVEEKMPWEANARLIAAAPEMFDVLRELYNASVLQSIPSDTALQKAITLYEKIEGDEGED